MLAKFGLMLLFSLFCCWWLFALSNTPICVKYSSRLSIDTMCKYSLCSSRYHQSLLFPMLRAFLLLAVDAEFVYPVKWYLYAVTRIYLGGLPKNPLGSLAVSRSASTDFSPEMKPSFNFILIPKCILNFKVSTTQFLQ